jgi:hypothetical protein
MNRHPCLVRVLPFFGYESPKTQNLRNQIQSYANSPYSVYISEEKQNISTQGFLDCPRRYGASPASAAWLSSLCGSGLIRARHLPVSMFETLPGVAGHKPKGSARLSMHVTYILIEINVLLRYGWCFKKTPTAVITLALLTVVFPKIYYLCGV